MKKIICMIMAIAILILTLSACGEGEVYNRSMYDMAWSFEYAYIYIGGEKLVEGKVTSWLDFEESDMIQVKIGGKTYLTHSSNVVLVHNSKGV